jgi:tetrapyrrole methylase family protein/MazG family protein
LTQQTKQYDITIVGLGPGGRGLLTLEADRALRKASEIYLRTVRHPVVDSLPARLPRHSFDYLYEEKGTFPEVYETIAQRIVELGHRPEGVVYAVPGHPLVAEESVRRILALAGHQDLTVRIVSALSFLDSLFVLLELDPLSPGLQVADATLLAAYVDSWHGSVEDEDGGRKHKAARLWSRPPFDATAPLIIAQLHDRSVASSVKLLLQEFYPADHPVALALWAGIPGKERKRSLPLFELDRSNDIDHLTSLYVPPIEIDDDLASLAGLRHIVARLRAPGGCPWDREQSHDSLKPYVVEETYEVVEALDEGNPDMLREELGDLLLQIVLHSQLATESGDFLMEDVFRGINSKLIRRHPHVFAERLVSDAQEVVRNWEQIKREEKREQTGEAKSSLETVPKSLPALVRAQSVQRRAARLGFDWKDIKGVVDKVAEEFRELESADSIENKRDELGDVIFALVNVARWLSIDAEDALRASTNKFVGRFKYVERLCQQRGLEMDKLPLEELDLLWDEAKQFPLP